MNRKVNLNRPEISSEEIQKRKNFDSVLKQAQPVGTKPMFKKPWFLSSVVAVTIAIVATVVLLNQNKKTSNNPVVENKTTTSDSLALQAFYKEEEAKPCINPPLEGLNVEYTSYKVIAEKGATLEFKTGSKITIPKNAFTDENGTILKGEIELRYREFHDAADFFVSGIPMTYDSAGVRYQFESAGMMEILAYQNGKKVNVAPQKEIEVEMASNDSDARYNLYRLDTMANNWSCLGKDKPVVRSEKPFDTKKFEKDVAVKEAVEKMPEYVALETKKVEAQKEKVVQMAALPKPIAEPKKPEEVKKGKFTFTLSVKPDEFPELSAYKGLLFEVGDENKNFSSAVYDIEWEDIVLKEGNKPGENYVIALKKGAKKLDIVAYPVYEGKNYETAMKTFQEKFNKYKTTLDKRLAEEKRVEDEYQAKIAAWQAKQAELVRAYEQKQAEAYKQMETNEKVMRMFRVNSFGVYNSDCAQKYPVGVLCNASLKNDLKKDLKCYEVYLVDKERTALFTYARNPLINFSFNPNSKNMLWTVENGVMYWLKPDQFSALTNGDSKDLILNKVDQKFENVDELKAYFNF